MTKSSPMSRHIHGFGTNKYSAPHVVFRMHAKLRRLFFAHLRSVNEAYLAHAAIAFRFAMILLGAAMAAFVHAVIPSLFEHTASSTIKALHGEMAARTEKTQSVIKLTSAADRYEGH